MTAIAPEIFKAYDIRGIVDRTLTEGARRGDRPRARHAGAAQGGREASSSGATGACRGRGWRAPLARGLNAAGIDVIDIGVVATPMVYFATHHFATGSGVMVTGSHNPPEYNGLKMMVGRRNARRRSDPGPARAGGEPARSRCGPPAARSPPT